MDYQNLKQKLMRTFQQLVIFDLREITYREVQSIIDINMTIDLTGESILAGGAKKRYFLGTYNYKPLLFILLDPKTGDEYHDDLTIIYNLYGAWVRNQRSMISFQEMEERATHLSDADKTIHWIWFRERETYLPDKIMSRAKSWIELNPDFKFNLWTNLTDQMELEDFISNLHESNREYFTTGKIVVRFQDEMLDCVQQFIQQVSFQLTDNTEIILRHLFDFTPPITNAESKITTNSTHTTVTTIIQTVTQNNYKINRIFRVDLLRVILISMLGGIYADFNDTICFYPMKYLLTWYHETYFVGTDYDLDHPIFRNNYLLYSSLGQQEFIDLTLMCVNKGVREYQRITAPEFINEYYQMCLDFLIAINQQLPTVQSEFYLTAIFLQLQRFRQILDDDKLKDPHRVMSLCAEIFAYFGQEFEVFKQLSQSLLSELEQLDINCLKIFRIKQKNTRRRRRTQNETISRVIYDQSMLDKMVTTFEFRNHFLMKYAIFMTIGDLILSTNIAYISEIKNLVPYSRSNRLSTISMITHVYDGTSYGLTKNYETYDQFGNDLRREFL